MIDRHVKISVSEVVKHALMNESLNKVTNEDGEIVDYHFTFFETDEEVAELLESDEMIKRQKKIIQDD